MSPRWLLLSALAVLSTASGPPRRCESITVPLCADIGYNFTAYPNVLGHESQSEAGPEVHEFKPLVEYGCYRHLKFFLCTLYTPICQTNYDKTVLPCREMCMAAREGCAPIMGQYGFRWPEALSCETLPSKADQAATGEICASPPDLPVTKGPSRHSPKPPAPVTRRPIIDDFARDRERNSGPCRCRCASPFVAHPTSSVGEVEHCSHACSAMLDADQKDFLQSWMAIWSIACIVATTFTLLTFLIEPDRFQYPERPIFVLAFCQLMVAIGIAIRVGMGHEAVACESNLLRNDQDSSASACFAVFLLTYFFGMAASVWWVLLSLTWVLAAGSKWSSEAIAGYSLYFHIIGWTVPSIQTIVVIAFNAIDGDAVSGLCSVGNTSVEHLKYFVLGPLFLYFSVGVVFLLVGFFNLWRIRSEVQRAHPGIEGAGRLTRLMSKIGVFSLLYTIPAVLAIIAYYYEEENRPAWEEAALCPCSERSREPANGTIHLGLALIKTASMLFLGCATGFWVMSPKTLSSWRARLCCTSGRASSTTKYQPAELIYAKSDCSGPNMYYNSSMRPLKNTYGYGDKL